ncbi:MFS transporter [Phenylobacterium immobile]|uniref:MFS transporter n=1 Tax=Phenylobacterium immobile TaxID=21 RepID=UPI00159ECF93|nr:MFS transporter [Phenylobacterium immobile]
MTDRTARKRAGDTGVDSGISRFSFGLVFASYFILAVGNMGLISVLPGIGREIGLPDPFIAAAFAISGIFLASVAPFWARTADRIGRKPVLITGLAGYTVSMALVGVVVACGLHKLAAWFIIAPCLIAARSIFGLVGSAILPSGQAYVAERTPRETRTRAISSLAGAQGLGTIIGPLIAPLFILPLVGLSGPMFGFAAIAGITLVLVLQFLNEGPKINFDDEVETAASVAEAEAAPARAWRDARIMPFVLFGAGMGVAQGAQAQILPFLIIDTLGAPPMQAQASVTLAMMLGAASGLVAQWGLIRLFKMKPKDLMKWGASVALLGHLLILTSTNMWGIMAGYAASCIGFSFGRPGYTAGLSLSVTQREQGRVAGIIAMLAGINVLAPFFVLIYQHDRNAPFALNAALIAGVLVYAVVQPRLKHSGVAARVS